MIPHDKPGLYRRLLSYAFRYKLFLFISVLGFAVYAAMEGALVWVIKFFIQRLEGKTVDPLPYLSSEVTGSIYFVPLAIIALSVIRGIGSYSGNFYMSKVGLNVVNTLRKSVFSHMLYLPQNYYDQRNSGELVSLIIYNIEQVTGSVTEAIKILLRDGFSVIFFLVCMFAISWKLTLTFMFVAPILGGIIYVASRYFRKSSRRIQTSVGQITHISTETFQGIKLVKSYLGEDYENRRFRNAADQNLNLATKFERVKALQTPVLHTVIACALALVFFLVMQIWEGDAADAVVYVGFAGMIAKPFRQLSMINSIIQRGMAAAESIFTALDTPAEINSGTRIPDKITGEIRFEDVCFGYAEDQVALDHLNLHIQAGETVALVGSSGSGKTTVASLLLRFYTPGSGRIVIDGIPISELPLSTLRQNIALVNQQTILFNDSVKANIAYGRDLAQVDEADILTAARHSWAEEFINKLENGFDTAVGEDGALLSGGQRQRLAIARGILKNAPILILDEATSALDNESEKQIQLALDKLKQGRTTLVIAHRLSTIENADRIVVLDRGRIVEQGKHQELIARQGYYANLHRTLANSPA